MKGLGGETGRIATGAGVGAILGGILGGGFKGTLAGILIGAGGTIAATEGRQVELPQGSVLRVRIDSPVQIDTAQLTRGIPSPRRDCSEDDGRPPASEEAAEPKREEVVIPQAVQRRCPVRVDQPSPLQGGNPAVADPALQLEKSGHLSGLVVHDGTPEH